MADLTSPYAEPLRAALDRLDGLAYFNRVHEAVLAVRDDVVANLCDELGLSEKRGDHYAEKARQAEAAIARVRELHQPTEGMGLNCDEDDTPGSYGHIAQVCTSCGTSSEYGVRWPCPTIRALDVPADGEQPGDVEVFEPSVSEWDMAVASALSQLGCTLQELEAMAEAGDFMSERHRQVWLTIKPADGEQTRGGAVSVPHSEDWRDDLIDRLPKGMVIWADDDELESFPWDLKRWLTVLGHEKAHTACCAACGCATTCTAGAFYDATVSSVVRELDRMGALREPAALPLPPTDGMQPLAPATEETDR